MPLFDYLKRALGFSHDQDDDEYPETPTGYRIDDDPPADTHDERPAGESKPQPEAPPSEFEKLRAQLAKITDERDAAKRAQLSAERQKRALSDRVYDLEEKLTAALEERDKLRDECQRLNVKVKTAAKSQPTEEKAAEPAPAAGPDPRDEEIASLKKDLEAVTLKCSVADAMVADLTSKASQSKRDRSKTEDEISQLRKQLKASEQRLKDTQADLDDAEAELKAAAVVVEKIKKVEELLSKKDMRIAELQRSLVMREKDVTSLNSTIEHNLRRHAEAEELMRREIQKLRSKLSMPATDPTKEQSVAAADSDTPVSETAHPSKPKSRRHGRRNRNNDNNDNQLSLF